MKSPVILLAVSLTANLALAAVFVARPALAPPAFRDFFSSRSADTEAGIAANTRQAAAADSKARLAVSRAAAAQTRLWSALVADDLSTLVARLRAAGFPPHIVRAIASAQIEKRFSARMQELIGGFENAPFWKPDPFSSMNNTKFREDYSQTYRERSKLLREMLGDDFFAFDADPSAAQRRQFGDMSKTKVDLVQRINDDYAEMISQIRASSQGITLPEDREKLALLEREKRADLAAFLTPQELEDYEMRSSPMLSRSRNTFTLMDATQDEFRAIFRTQQPFNERINPTSVGMMSFSFGEGRREAQNQMYEALKAALSPARYADYMRAQNPEYQAIHRIAERENIPLETALRTFNLRDHFAAESARIMDNGAMDADQKRAAFKTLAQDARLQIIGNLGQTAGTAYAQSARWVGYIENGGAVSFGPDGSPTYRGLPQPPPPKK